MKNLIKIELIKIFRRPITYIGFAALCAIVLVMQLALFSEGEQMLDFVLKGLSEQFLLEGNLLNGYLVAFFLLNSLWVLMPFLVTLVCGALLAGEAANGTFRILLLRPVSREKIVLAKFFAGLVYTFLLVIFLMVLSLGIGITIFGTGDLIILNENIVILSSDDVLWRFLGAFGFGVVGMVVIASLALLLSSASDNPVGPVIGTMAIVIGFTIITNLHLDLFRILEKYIFTSYTSSWTLFFDLELNSQKIFQSLGILGAHIVLFLGATIYIFRKKDILT